MWVFNTSSAGQSNSRQENSTCWVVEYEEQSMERIMFVWWRNKHHGAYYTRALFITVPHLIRSCDRYAWEWRNSTISDAQAPVIEGDRVAQDYNR